MIIVQLKKSYELNFSSLIWSKHAHWSNYQTRPHSVLYVSKEQVTPSTHDWVNRMDGTKIWNKLHYQLTTESIAWTEPKSDFFPLFDKQNLNLLGILVCTGKFSYNTYVNLWLVLNFRPILHYFFSLPINPNKHLKFLNL